MELIDAIKARHAVRKYTGRPIEAEKIASLRAATEKLNAESGLHLQLVLDEPKAFSSGILKYGAISGVRNYFAMVGKKGREVEEKIGYYGEQLVLLAQTLGLNTCWVGLTFKEVDEVISLADGEQLHCVIALGYGVDAGKQHPLKPIEKFYEAKGEIPEWFRRGMDAAVLAPTAVNQQKFKFILHEGNKVSAEPTFSLTGRGYLYYDLGIVKCHFEIGAGKEHFTWL